MEKTLPKRKKIHLEYFDYTDPNAVYFITICTHNKISYFKKPEIAKYIADEIDYRSRIAGEVKVLAHCIMPDHVHLLLKISESYGRSLANWVAAFKRYNARVLSMIHGIKPLWQANFYEHVVRKDESLMNIAEYIANNPVRKNLVLYRHDYPFAGINNDAFP